MTMMTMMVVVRVVAFFFFFFFFFFYEREIKLFRKDDTCKHHSPLIPILAKWNTYHHHHITKSIDISKGKKNVIVAVRNKWYRGGGVAYLW